MMRAMWGLGSNLLAAVIWSLLLYGWLLGLRRRRFGHLSGRYAVRKKVTGQSVVWSVTMRRRPAWRATNTFDVEYEYAEPHGDCVAGEIAMSDLLPMCGEGAYTHETPKYPELWGAWTVTTAPRRDGIPTRLLVDRRYSNTYGGDPNGMPAKREELEAYVWTQVERFPDRVSRVRAWSVRLLHLRRPTDS